MRVWLGVSLVALVLGMSLIFKRAGTPLGEYDVYWAFLGLFLVVGAVLSLIVELIVWAVRRGY